MKEKSAIIESEIGKRIRSFRRGKHITLEQLAKQAGFTKGYLSKIEKSDKAPPLSTLGTIAHALGVTISALLGEPALSAPITLVRKEERSLIARNGTAFGYSYEAVAHTFPNKLMEPFVLTLPRNPKKKTIHRHEGQEILFVLSGTMKFLHGTEEFILKEGDCIYFDSGYPHVGSSIGDKDVKCLMVIYNASDKL
jgi:transcriptional regulator with XRE-family HTH domain